MFYINTRCSFVVRSAKIRNHFRTTAKNYRHVDAASLVLAQFKNFMNEFEKVDFVIVVNRAFEITSIWFEIHFVIGFLPLITDE